MIPAEVQQIAEHLLPGEHRVVCPLCSPMRKKKSLKDLSIKRDGEGFTYYCHHCGEKGGKLEKEKDFMPARNIPKIDVSDEALAYLHSRGISTETAAKAGLYETRSWFQKLQREDEAIAYPYLSPKDDKTEYAAKLRAISDKAFSANGSPQTLFNIQNHKEGDPLIICEGEMDALSFMEAGINATSIPAGASNTPLKDGAPALRYLRHHAKLIEATDKVILALDCDEPGETTAGEIARRIGRSKCWSVSYAGGCKDANDVLMKHGPKALRDCIKDVKPWPVQGLYTVDEYLDDVMGIWKDGVIKGASTGFNCVDNIYTVGLGQLTVVTGHPNSGKSEFVDELMVNLAVNEGWKFAICSFENHPRIHIPKLVHKYIGMPFFDGNVTRMTDAQRDKGLKFVHMNFSFIHDADGSLSDLDGVLDRLRAAVLRYGIKGCVIDPYNYIARPKDMSETEWISIMLSKVRSFAQANDVHVWFVAHPQKLQSADGNLRVPKGNDISGSAAWWAKADMGISIHRPDPIGSFSTEVHVWKVRFSWMGRQGAADLYFNPDANQLVEPGNMAVTR